jgi:hypothetical protein
MINEAMLRKAIEAIIIDPERASQYTYPRLLAMSLLSTHEESLAAIAEELNKIITAPPLLPEANDATI